LKALELDAKDKEIAELRQALTEAVELCKQSAESNKPLINAVDELLDLKL
jgi:hypothetical protein